MCLQLKIPNAHHSTLKLIFGGRDQRRVFSFDRSGNEYYGGCKRKYEFLVGKFPSSMPVDSNFKVALRRTCQSICLSCYRILRVLRLTV
ncbi:MAG: hypothetical protein ACI9CO_000095 [Candidatus Azotimanducaceae bacterium]|jgi:hypothetical protein